jgi:lysylphosphatidylglycerol synthetase-like protein (DUF2156 family)
MKDKKRLMIAAAVLLVAVALFLIGMIFLPDVIVMQVKMDGTPSSTLPKLVGLILPLALTGIFAFLYYKNGTSKSLLVSIIGLVSFGLMFFANR